MSRVLVTGGAGFIGSHVVDALIQAGYEVIVVDDLSRGHRSNINPETKFYQVDIRSEELAPIFAHERPEYVNHHAAHIDLRRSLEDPLHDASANILGSINLLECCRRYGVRKIIYASSVAVYGQPEHLPCDENHPIRPSSPYGASKYAVEPYLHIYRENHRLDFTILRYPNVYGPRQDPLGEAGVVAIFSLQMLMGEQVRINGSGDQERDFLYVEDCVRANLLSMEKGSGEVYNLGTGKGTSINRLFEEMRRLTGYSHHPVHGPPKPGEVFRICLDANKASKELQWSPTHGLQEGLERTLAYFKEHLAIIEKPSRKKSN
jgi:UDP-glucose 4-epimerase